MADPGSGLRRDCIGLANQIRIQGFPACLHERHVAIADDRRVS